jgi:predicted metal-dependent enzyme (double-stranded beta helix superfamily)
MEQILSDVISECERALESAAPKGTVDAVVLRAARNPPVARAIFGRTKLAAAPHNHNLWSVVGVCEGQEDNLFFERSSDGIRQIGQISVVGPGVICNGADVIHSIRNPLDSPLVVPHACGGGLFGVPRSNWNPDTHEEVPFDWQNVRSETAG